MAWYNASWTNRVKVTVLATKVDADLTNFPVYVDLSGLPAGFHTNVNQTDGRDIRVTKADGSTELAREVVFYDSATNTGELHFKADALANATDTDFYIYYGNAAATEPAVGATYGRNAVWSDYKAVYHMHQDPTGTVIVDAATMTKSDTGIYYYNYHAGVGVTAMDKGKWRGVVTITDGSGATAIITPIPFAFEVG